MEKEEKWQIRGVRAPPWKSTVSILFWKLRKLKNFNVGNYSRSLECNLQNELEQS